MIVQLENIGKRFNSEWIFRGLNYRFSTGNKYALLGSNGSGKSTLLQLILGNSSPSEGSIRYSGEDGNAIADEKIFEYISFASPYLEPEEELTLSELINFHFRFKKFLPGFSEKQVIEAIALPAPGQKQVKYFSSGMKQRLKLGLAFLCDTPVILLDEPASNLDADGVSWYRQMISNFTANRLVIICSNHTEAEYDFCKGILNIGDYKQKLF